MGFPTEEGHIPSHLPLSKEHDDKVMGNTDGGESD